MEKVLFHISHNDLDGYGSQYFTEQIKHNFKHVNYSNISYIEIKSELKKVFNLILKNQKENYILLITDISLNIEEVKTLTNFKKNNPQINIEFQLLDHHEIDKAKYIKYKWYHCDITKCGSMLTYIYMNENYNLDKENLKIANFIQCHDLWKEQDKDFSKANYLSDMVFTFGNYPWLLKDAKRTHIFFLIEELTKRFFNNTSVNDIENTIYKINTQYIEDTIITIEGKLPEELKGENIPYKLKRSYLLSILFNKEKKPFVHSIYGYKGLFLFNFSQQDFQYMSSFYLKSNKDIDYLIHVTATGGMSFRSINKRINLSSIARKYFNGGGHKQAAGAFFSKIGKIHSQQSLDKEVKKIINDKNKHKKKETKRKKR